MSAAFATALAGAFVPGAASADAINFDHTYTTTGSEQSHAVPPGVRFAHVTLIGGRGANTTNNSGLSAAGGRGALVQGALEVSGDGGGRTLYLEVGGNGQTVNDNSNNPGGFNGGGQGLSTGTPNGGFNAGGGGGGASDIRTISRFDDGTLDSRLVIAAGGGGAGRPQNGTNAASGNAGAGGNAGTTGNGTNGGTSPFGAGGGVGATLVAGGAAGGGSGTAGTGGGSGNGGNGGPPGQNNPSGGGGGGGGGLFGGGGGRGGFIDITNNGGGGGGGGGTSLVPAGFTASVAGPSDNPSIRIAYTRPDTSIDSGPPPVTSDPDPAFTFSASEEESTFTCRLDEGAEFPCTSPWAPEEPLEDGQHTFAVFATNEMGNFDPDPATRTFRVDTTPPTVTITSGPAGTTHERSPTFGYEADETGVDFRCGVDGELGDCPDGQATVGPLDAGPHTFSVVGTDQAGNEGPPATRSFTVAPPKVQLKLGKAKLNKRRGTARVTADVSAPGELMLRGAKVKPVDRRAGKAGTVKLPVKAVGKAAKRLRKKGKLKVSVTVSFEPDWGVPAERKAKLKLKKKKKKRR